jgi:cytochrome c553
MALPVAAVDAALLPDLAKHFAALPSRKLDKAHYDPALVRRGEDIARVGIPDAKVPACLGCHGASERNPLYPKIARQPEAYIAVQLDLFRDGKRGGTEFSHLMTNAAKRLSDAHIAAVAAYFSTLPETPATRAP